MPKVSVIIPIYNTEKYLRKCLDSVCNQTLSDIEIICVNDCSTDNSLEILEEYASKDNRIKLIDFKENKGAAVARNAGIDEAKGEYIGFVDSDDFIDLDFYEKLYNKAVKSGADCVKSNMVLENLNNNIAIKEYHNLIDVQKNKLTLNHIPTTLIKKTFLRNNNITFPESLKSSEDCVFEVMIGVNANHIDIVDNTFYHYIFNNQSLNNTEVYSIEKIKNLLLSFEIIVDYANSHKLSEIDYKNLIINRYNILINTAFDKSEYNYDYFSILEQEILKISAKTKGVLPNILPSKINLIKKVAELRLKNHNKESKIPKRIFYVWGANEPLKDSVKTYIASWKKYLPDYEIIQIDENSKKYFNFEKELNDNKWFRTVYDKKMWAYVSDYVRIKTLYHNGGIYFDTDVEVLQSLDEMLNEPAFVGIQDSSLDGKEDFVEPAILGAQMGNLLLAKISCFYDELIWEEPIYTMPQIFDYFLKKYNITPFAKKKNQKIIKLNDLTIYPESYFIPFRYKTEYTEDCIESNTRTIHWWGASWIKPEIIEFLDKKHILTLLRKRIAK